MILRNFIVILVLTLSFGCNLKKKEKDVIIELKNDVSLKEENTDNIYREITDLEKYAGFTKIVGMVLDGTENALVYLQKDSLQVLVLEQIIKDNPSKVNYKILDEVRLITKKSILFSETTSCDLIENMSERFIFGIAKDQDKEYFDKDHLLGVWKINLSEKKFEPIESERVKCHNHWFGYDKDV